MSRDLFFEIGTEEIPARFINNALLEIENILTKDLGAKRISFDEIKTYATPRRFAIQIKNVAEKQSDFQEELKGPSKKIALDADGNPTKALQGFVKSKGGELDNVVFKNIDGDEYVYLTIFSQGKETKLFVKAILENVIRNMNFPKPMKWGNKNLKFIRPIRWLIAFFGDELMNFDIEEIHTSNVTKGHRFLGSPEIVVNNFEDYKTKLAENFVILDHIERKNLIKEQVIEVAKTLGGEAIIDEEILDEVNFIVEYPTAFYGNFDSDYLKLPKEAVITPMKNHQRYFPVINSEGELMPHFITVRNGDSYMIDNVRKSNQKVLDARLKDALFFYEEDTKKPLEDFVPNLETIVFHQKLGTMRDKVDRINNLALSIANKLDFRKEFISRTALLAKADLTTQMVFEFGELQGIMGRYYATLSGEPSEVADGIFEHYLPRNAEDEIAKSPEGIALSLADKMDTISGFFSIGIQPTGSQDPYALRRQAIGVLSTMIERKLNLSIAELVELACSCYPFEVSAEAKENLLSFMMLRLRNILLDQGIRYDIVNGLKNHLDTPVYRIVEIAQAVDSWLKEDKSVVLTSLLRGNNLMKHETSAAVSEDLFEHESEKLLHEEVKKHQSSIRSFLSDGKYLDALVLIENFASPIDQLFDNVMIMHKDEAIKNNRLALVKSALVDINKIVDIDEIIYK